MLTEPQKLGTIGGKTWDPQVLAQLGHSINKKGLPIKLSALDVSKRFGKKPLIESLITPPGDITMTELSAPQRRIRV